MIDSTALLSLVTVRDQESFVLVKDLERIFLSQTPILFQQMYKGIELKRSEMICRSAHTLKTSCSYLGIVEMANLCREIEARGNNEELSYLDISILLQRLERSYCESIVELKSLIARLGRQEDVASRTYYS